MDALQAALGFALLPYLGLLALSALASIYYVMMVFDNVQPGKGWLLLIAPALYFLPDCLTPKGNYYRRRAIWVIAILWMLRLTGWYIVLA